MLTANGNKREEKGFYAYCEWQQERLHFHPEPAWYDEKNLEDVWKDKDKLLPCKILFRTIW